jgi:asparagine synthase (glutamine-hydrolysing)
MILGLSALLERSIELSLEDKVSISFSGGLDSTLIASVARKHAALDLITVGTPGSSDLEYSEKIATELKLPLHKVLLDENSIMSSFMETHSMLPMDVLKVEILVPVYKAAEKASGLRHKVLLFGTGAEELFVGYKRYFQYLDEGKDLDAILAEEFRTLKQREIAWISKVCRKFGVEARYPFYNPELAELMFSVPLEDRVADRTLRKGLLREAAKMLGTPKLALQRPKKAMQYGSGIHKIIMKNSGLLNRKYPSDQNQVTAPGLASLSRLRGSC